MCNADLMVQNNYIECENHAHKFCLKNNNKQKLSSVSGDNAKHEKTNTCDNKRGKKKKNKMRDKKKNKPEWGSHVLLFFFCLTNVIYPA